MRRLVPVIAVAVSLVAGPAWAAPVPSPTPEPPRPGPAVGGPRLASVNVTLPAGVKPPRDISARGWVVADLDSGQVLGARDAHGRFPPASTLKWLTALTLLPSFPDRSKKVACVDADVNVDGTRVGLIAHGHYSLDLLFQSMLMASGNDAANTLARVAGGVPRTVARMNATAASLQALDTHAATPSGLDGPGQLTSAYDLALIGRAALRRSDFRRYTGQTRGTIPAQNTKYHAFEFANDNKLLYNYPGAFGGKNGFTDAARHTFIGVARRGDRRLIVTMMYGEHRPTVMSDQAGKLLDWGFALRPGTAPVGTLVGPATAPASSAPPTAAPAPAPSPATAAPAAAPASTDLPIALLAVAAVAAVLLGGAAFAITNRRGRAS